MQNNKRMQIMSSRGWLVIVNLCLLVAITSCGAAFKGKLVAPAKTAPEINLTDGDKHNPRAKSFMDKVKNFFAG